MSPRLARKVQKQQQVYTPADIIKANFPVYESFRNIRLGNINKTLSVALGVLLIFSVVMYAFVVVKQQQIEIVHKETKKIYTENIELQSKLDYLRSFDNIDAKLSSSHFLKKPDKVIEVSKDIPNLKVKFEKKGPNIQSMLGY